MPRAEQGVREVVRHAAQFRLQLRFAEQELATHLGRDDDGVVRDVEDDGRVGHGVGLRCLGRQRLRHYSKPCGFRDRHHFALHTAHLHEPVIRHGT